MNANEIISQAFIAKELFGIDPGRSNGGVVKFSNGKYESWPLKKMNEFEDMVDFFKYQKEICDLPLIFLERITTFAGDYAGNDIDKKKAYVGRAFQMDKLKRHYTEITAALKIAKIPYIEVMPGQWQKYLKVHIPNEDTGVRKRRFKDIASDWFSGNNVVGWNADAYLLIEFGRRKLKYDQRWIRSKTNKPLERERRLF